MKEKADQATPTDPSVSKAEAEVTAQAGMDDFLEKQFGNPADMPQVAANVPPIQGQGQPVAPSGQYGQYGDIDQHGNPMQPPDSGGLHGGGSPIRYDMAPPQQGVPAPQATPAQGIPQPPPGFRGGVPPQSFDGQPLNADQYFGNTPEGPPPAQGIPQAVPQPQGGQPPAMIATPEGNYLGTYKTQQDAEVGLSHSQTHIQKIEDENRGFREKYGALEGQIQMLTKMMQGGGQQPQQQPAANVGGAENWDSYEDRLRGIADKHGDWVASAQMFADLRTAEKAQEQQAQQQQDMALNQWKTSLRTANPGISDVQLNEVMNEYNKLSSQQNANPLELIYQAKYSNRGNGVQYQGGTPQVQGMPPVVNQQPGQPPTYAPVQNPQGTPLQQPQPHNPMAQANHQRQVEAMNQIKRNLPPVSGVAPPPVNLQPSEHVQNMKNAWNNVMQGNQNIDDGLDDYTSNLFQNHYQTFNRKPVAPVPINRGMF